MVRILQIRLGILMILVLLYIFLAVGCFLGGVLTDIRAWCEDTVARALRVTILLDTQKHAETLVNGSCIVSNSC